MWNNSIHIDPPGPWLQVVMCQCLNAGIWNKITRDGRVHKLIEVM